MVILRFSTPSLPVVKEAELQISAQNEHSRQDEQSRSSDDSVSPGHRSEDSWGQLVEDASEKPHEPSSAHCGGTQHSTRMPPLQRVGIPTSPQTAAMVIAIRIMILEV
jgi:hypothetical protein